MKNGLSSFVFRSEDVASRPALSGRAPGGAQGGGGSESVAEAEAAARAHLARVFDPAGAFALDRPAADWRACEFRVVGVETQSLTSTTTVTFRQTFHRVPVYGSVVRVELDEKGELLALRAVLGRPSGVDPVALISPAEVLEALRVRGGPGVVARVPRLYVYFDAAVERWRLVYVLEGWPASSVTRGRGAASALSSIDYVIDAHTGVEIDALLRGSGGGDDERDASHDEGAGVPPCDLLWPEAGGRCERISDGEGLPSVGGRCERISVGEGLSSAGGGRGGAHAANGIPNFAAHRIIAAEDGNGAPLFTTAELAALFYLALTQYMPKNPRVEGARAATELAAEMLFQHEDDSARAAKLAAIAWAFDEKGAVS
jgi:fungalysin/thermolysin propeptide